MNEHPPQQRHEHDQPGDFAGEEGPDQGAAKAGQALEPAGEARGICGFHGSIF